jgi:hypothetical protein
MVDLKLPRLAYVKSYGSLARSILEPRGQLYWCQVVHDAFFLDFLMPKLLPFQCLAQSISAAATGALIVPT